MSRSESGEATAEPGREVDEAGEERVGLVGREGTDDEDRHDEAVHGDDSGHHDGDERLGAAAAGQPWAMERGCERAGRVRTFMMSSGRSVPIPAIPIPALDVPYAAPTAAKTSGVSCPAWPRIAPLQRGTLTHSRRPSADTLASQLHHFAGRGEKETHSCRDASEAEEGRIGRAGDGGHGGAGESGCATGARVVGPGLRIGGM